MLVSLSFFRQLDLPLYFSKFQLYKRNKFSNRFGFGVDNQDFPSKTRFGLWLDRILCHPKFFVITPTQPQLNSTLHNKSWDWHENTHPPPSHQHHKNSMSAISQLLLTWFLWNFKRRFLWTSRTVEPNIDPQYWTQYWTHYST